MSLKSLEAWFFRKCCPVNYSSKFKAVCVIDNALNLDDVRKLLRKYNQLKIKHRETIFSLDEMTALSKVVAKVTSVTFIKLSHEATIKVSSQSCLKLSEQTICKSAEPSQAPPHYGTYPCLSLLGVVECQSNSVCCRRLTYKSYSLSNKDTWDLSAMHKPLLFTLNIHTSLKCINTALSC